MSGRGRGRGRGGGSGGPANGKTFLKRSAMEAGLTSQNLEDFLKMGRPGGHGGLFPAMRWHSSGRMWNEADDEKNKIAGETPSVAHKLATTKRTPGAIYCMNQQRRIMEFFQASPHYVRPAQQIDVERHCSKKNNRQKRVPVDVAVLNSMGSITAAAASSAGNNSGDDNRIQHPKLATDVRYFPPELLASVLKSGKKKKSSLSLDHGDAGASLKDLKEQEVSGVANPTDQEAGKDDEDEDEVVEEDAEELEDYTRDYYASDDESDGGDGEPSF